MCAEILDRVLDIFALLEAVGSRDFIIKVNLFLIEDEDITPSNYVSIRVNQVTSSVNQATILVIELSIGCLEDNMVATRVRFKLT